MDKLVATVELDPALLIEFIQLADAESGAIDCWHQSLDAEFIKAVAVFRVLDFLRSQQEPQFVDSCWRESLLLALTNESLARLLGGNSREAYLTGLLANIGRYVLFNQHGQEYIELVQGVGSSHTDLLARERHTYGTDSLELASGLLAGWHCSSFVVDAIAYHHLAPELLLDADLLVRVTAVSRWLNPILCGSGSGVDGALYSDIKQLLGVDKESLDELISSVSKKADQALASVGVTSDTKVELSEVTQPSDRSSLRNDVDNLSVVALFQNALDRSDDSGDWWDLVQKSARLLFGFKSCFLFDVDLERNLIKASEFSPAVSRFTIIRQPERSLLVDCLVKGEVIDSFGVSRMTVVDRQLCNQAGTKDIVCLPLLISGNPIGVLVAGVELQDFQRLEQVGGLLSLFSNMAANTLLLRQSRQKSNREDQSVSANTNSIDLDYLKLRTREVIHEVSNPLSIVQNYLKILSLKLEDDHSAQNNLKIISDEMIRISSIINKFREIGHDDTSSNQININRTVSDMVAVIREATPDIKILLDLDASAPLTLVDPDALKQVLINLIQNAVEAVEAVNGVGNVHVQTRSQVNVNGTMFVELVVSDDGPGIPATLKRNLFAPVETTKGGQHEGLGLTIVKRLVDEMQGTISCRNGTEEGAYFQVLIPQQGLEN